MGRPVGYRGCGFRVVGGEGRRPQSRCPFRRTQHDEYRKLVVALSDLNVCLVDMRRVSVRYSTADCSSTYWPDVCYPIQRVAVFSNCLSVSRAVGLLAQLPELDTLLLDSVTVTPRDMAAIARLNKLRELRCDQMDVDDALVQPLADSRSLESLALRTLGSYEPKGITGAGLAAVAGLRKLKELRLSGHPRLQPEAFRVLARSENLENIEVRGCPFNDAACRALTAGPRPLPKLKTLWLTYTDVGDAGCRGLSRLEGLEELHLETTQVGDAGCREIARLQKLLRLCLGGTSVGDAGCGALCQMGSLIELDLWGTRVADRGLADLSRLDNLRALTLPPNITDAGMAALPHFARLETLDVVAGSGQALVGIAKMAHLKSLVVRATKPWTRAEFSVLAGLGATLEDLGLYKLELVGGGRLDVSVLTKLRTLWVEPGPLSDEDVRTVAALPKLQEFSVGGRRFPCRAKSGRSGLPCLRRRSDMPPIVSRCRSMARKHRYGVASLTIAAGVGRWRASMAGFRSGLCVIVILTFKRSCAQHALESAARAKRQPLRMKTPGGGRIVVSWCGDDLLLVARPEIITGLFGTGQEMGKGPSVLRWKDVCPKAPLTPAACRPARQRPAGHFAFTGDAMIASSSSLATRSRSESSAQDSCTPTLSRTNAIGPSTRPAVRSAELNTTQRSPGPPSSTVYVEGVIASCVRSCMTSNSLSRASTWPPPVTATT